jgi:hypothetical protein
VKISKIRLYNKQDFIDDLNSARRVLSIPKYSGVLLQTTKKWVSEQAEDNKIEYYMTNKLFIVPQNVMVII